MLPPDQLNNFKETLWIGGQIVLILTGILTLIVGIRAAARYLREQKDKSKHEAAKSLVSQVISLQSAIAVARTSWRTTFLTSEVTDLTDPAKVRALRMRTNAEKEYWLKHLDEMERLGRELREKGALALAIWPEIVSACLDKFKESVSVWQKAVNERVDQLSDFDVIPKLEYINTANAILIADSNVEPKLFPGVSESELRKYREASFAYWKELEKAVAVVRDAVGRYLR